MNIAKNISFINTASFLKYFALIVIHNNNFIFLKKKFKPIREMLFVAFFSLAIIACNSQSKSTAGISIPSSNSSAPDTTDSTVNQLLSKITLTTTSFDLFQKDTTQIILLFSESFPVDISLNWSLNGSNLNYFEESNGSITMLKGENSSSIRLKPKNTNPSYSEVSYSFILTPSNVNLKLPSSIALKLVDDRAADFPILTGLPTDPSNSTSLNVSIAGTGVVSYKYKVGVSSSTDCSVSSGYSSDTSISQNITANVSSLPDGNISLCVIGIDGAGHIQPYSSATTTSWFKDTAAPTALLNGTPLNPSNATQMNVTISGAEVLSYKYKVGVTSLIDCSSSADYSVDTLVSQNIVQNINALSDGNITLCVIGKDAVGNYQSYLNATSVTWLKDTLAPTVTLSDGPSSPSNVTSLNMTPSGIGVSAYKFKIGVSASLDCSVSSGYSDEILVNQNITSNLTSLAEGNLTICVVGRDTAGNYQLYSSASTLSWVKDTEAPVAILSGTPTNPGNTTSLNVSVSGAGVSAYKFKLGIESTTDCSSSAGYSAETVTSQNISTDVSAYAEGSIKLCVIGKDAAENYQSYNSATTYIWLKELPTEINFDSSATIIAQEIDGVISFNVQMDAPRAINTAKVNLQWTGTAVSGGVDYTDLNAAEVSFSPGTTLATVQISLVDDSLVEPLEYIDVKLNSMIQGNAVIGATNTRRIIIRDNDPEQSMMIVSAASHNCVKTTDGKVKCWGKNAQGQLGLGDTQNRGDNPDELGSNLPYVDLGTGVKVLKLSAGQGGEHTCALTDSNDIKCWGHGSTWSEPGHMGYGNSNNIGDGPGEMGNNLSNINLGTSVKAIDLTTSSFNSCVITSDDRAKCWGVGYYGANGNASTARIGSSAAQMGNNLPYMDFGTNRKVLKIAMGAFHRCAILDNLKLKCWGWNAGGQLGYEDLVTRGDNAGEMGDNLPYVDLGTNAEVVDVVAATGSYYESGSVHHTCALLATGKVKCWGEGGSGQLGYGSTVDKGGVVGDMGENLPFVNLGTERTAVRIFASNFSTCAILDNHDLKCWGAGQAGQLGYDSTANKGISSATIGDNLSSVFLGTGRYALSVSGSFTVWGSGHRCAVLDSFDIKCWGKNIAGELGLGQLTTTALGDSSGEMATIQPIPLF